MIFYHCELVCDLKGNLFEQNMSHTAYRYVFYPYELLNGYWGPFCLLQLADILDTLKNLGQFFVFVSVELTCALIDFQRWENQDHRGDIFCELS